MHVSSHAFRILIVLPVNRFSEPSIQDKPITLNDFMPAHSRGRVPAITGSMHDDLNISHRDKKVAIMYVRFGFSPTSKTIVI